LRQAFYEARVLISPQSIYQIRHKLEDRLIDFVGCVVWQDRQAGLFDFFVDQLVHRVM
jgi:hypothetical protein